MPVERANRATTRLDLQGVVRRLHGSDIRVGCHSFDGCIHVWISDRLDLVRADRVFEQSSATAAWKDSAALWLHASALRLFPGSRYARDQLVTLTSFGMERKEAALVDGPRNVAPAESRTEAKSSPAPR
jgi:hypothetical protein